MYLCALLETLLCSIQRKVTLPKHSLVGRPQQTTASARSLSISSSDLFLRRRLECNATLFEIIEGLLVSHAAHSLSVEGVRYLGQSINYPISCERKGDRVVVAVVVQSCVKTFLSSLRIAPKMVCHPLQNCSVAQYFAKPGRNVLTLLCSAL